MRDSHDRGVVTGAWAPVTTHDIAGQGISVAAVAAQAGEDLRALDAHGLESLAAGLNHGPFGRVSLLRAAV